MGVDVFVISILVGWLRRGSIKGFLNLRIKGIWVIVLSFILQFVVYSQAQRGNRWFVNYGEWLIILAYVILIYGLIININIYSFKLILSGVILNFVVIALNGGRMPVSHNALVKTGIIDELRPLFEKGWYGRYIPMTESTHLKFLGDILFIPRPYIRPSIFSIGDVLLFIGIFLLIQKFMTINMEGRK
jgi:hypothetical protein